MSLSQIQCPTLYLRNYRTNWTSYETQLEQRNARFNGKNRNVKSRISIVIRKEEMITEETETILETGNLCIKNLLKELHSFSWLCVETSLESSTVELLPESCETSSERTPLSFEALKGSKKSLFPWSTATIWKTSLNLISNFEFCWIHKIHYSSIENISTFYQFFSIISRLYHSIKLHLLVRTRLFGDWIISYWLTKNIGFWCEKIVSVLSWQPNRLLELTTRERGKKNEEEKEDCGPGGEREMVKRKEDDRRRVSEEARELCPQRSNREVWTPWKLLRCPSSASSSSRF